MQKLIKITLVVLFIFISFSFGQNTHNYPGYKEPIELILTKENLYKQLLIENILFPEIVFCQAILETGHLKSINYKNNLFGFRTKAGYLTFDSWEESVKKMKRWQNTHYKKGNYYVFLRKIGYAESKIYELTLKKIYNENRSNFTRWNQDQF